MTDTKELRELLAVASSGTHDIDTRKLLDALPGLLDERDEKEDLADYWKNECDISTKLAEQAEADLAALRERMEAVEELAEVWSGACDDPACAQPADLQQKDCGDRILAILSDDQPTTEAGNRRGKEQAVMVADEMARAIGDAGLRRALCGFVAELRARLLKDDQPATEPPSATQDQIHRNNVWLAAVEARGFCRMLEVSEADVTLSPAYEALLEALKLAGLDVHAEPATEPKP